MLRFLFGTKPNGHAKAETQREVITRLLADLNTAIDGLPKKPKVTIDPATGGIDLHLPEQLPDEALALPAPGQDCDAETRQDDAEDPSAEREASQDKAA